MIVISGYRHKLRQTFTKPHGNVSLHIDSKRFKSFLQATDGKVAQAADILTKINPSNLRQAQGTHWDKTWGVKQQEINDLWKTFLSRHTSLLLLQLMLIQPGKITINSYLPQFQCLWKPSLSLNHWSTFLHWAWTWCSSQSDQSYSQLHHQTATDDQRVHCQYAIFEPGKGYIINHQQKTTSNFSLKKSKLIKHRQMLRPVFVSMPILDFYFRQTEC